MCCGQHEGDVSARPPPEKDLRKARKPSAGERETGGMPADRAQNRRWIGFMRRRVFLSDKLLGVRTADEKLDAGNVAWKAEAVQNAKACVSLLRQHIAKEDGVLFPMADNVIPPRRRPNWPKHSSAQGMMRPAREYRRSTSPWQAGWRARRAPGLTGFTKRRALPNNSPERTQPQREFMYDVGQLRRSARGC